MILDKTLQNIKKATTDMWHKCWTEANGGNITVRLDHGIVNDIAAAPAEQWLELPTPCPNLAGELFFVTGTGQYLRNIEISPEENGDSIELSGDGKAYRMVWGLKMISTPLQNFLRICSRMKQSRPKRPTAPKS